MNEITAPSKIQTKHREKSKKMCICVKMQNNTSLKQDAYDEFAIVYSQIISKIWKKLFVGFGMLKQAT